MELYVVTLQGVYPQGTVGVASSLVNAMVIVEEAARFEPDDYHDFRIHQHVLNVRNGQPKMVAEYRRHKSQTLRAVTPNWYIATDTDPLVLETVRKRGLEPEGGIPAPVRESDA